MKEENKKILSIQANALIDTGAALSVLTPKIAAKLQLTHTGYQEIFSVQDEQMQPVYYSFIIFPWGSGMEIPMACCPLREFDCLIGRDILKHWHLTYNGADGSITICDKKIGNRKERLNLPVPSFVPFFKYFP